jgi:hypothetical protein
MSAQSWFLLALGLTSAWILIRLTHQPICILALCWLQEVLESEQTHNARKLIKNSLPRKRRRVHANTLELQPKMTSQV